MVDKLRSFIWSISDENRVIIKSFHKSFPPINQINIFLPELYLILDALRVYKANIVRKTTFYTDN